MNELKEIWVGMMGCDSNGTGEPGSPYRTLEKAVSSSGQNITSIFALPGKYEPLESLEKGNGQVDWHFIGECEVIAPVGAQYRSFWEAGVLNCSVFAEHTTFDLTNALPNGAVMYCNELYGAFRAMKIIAPCAWNVDGGVYTFECPEVEGVFMQLGAMAILRNSTFRKGIYYGENGFQSPWLIENCMVIGADGGPAISVNAANLSPISIIGSRLLSEGDYSVSFNPNLPSENVRVWSSNSSADKPVGFGVYADALKID